MAGTTVEGAAVAATGVTGTATACVIGTEVATTSSTVDVGSRAVVATAADPGANSVLAGVAPTEGTVVVTVSSSLPLARTASTAAVTRSAATAPTKPPMRGPRFEPLHADEVWHSKVR